MILTTVKAKVPLCTRSNSFQFLESRQATLAFADDTIWMAENIEQMEETIKIVEEFFKINDIQINAKKSKLLVLNGPKKRESNTIKLCGSLVQEEKQNSITRFLGITEHYIKLRLQVGIYKARIVNDSWSPIELPKLKYIWKNNLTCLTILKAKLLYLEISNITLDWRKKENARALNLVFKELFDIKIRSGGKTRGKKPKWFSLLEEKIIENAEEKTIKPEWINGQTNQFGSSVSLLEISNDKKKKKWVLSKEVSEVAKLETRIEKCLGCEHNRSIVERNCTMRIRFDMAREIYNKDPPKNEQEFKNLRSLESPEKELILQAEVKEELKEEILAILTRNSNCQKRKYYYYTDGFLQKDNKDKGNIAVMGVAIVQVDEKEEVSLEEISAYTTGWPSSTRAELLAIWIATLLSPSKTEVVIKTDSAVSIMNIETSKYTAMARQ
ncbi:5435_t:CDS:2 [Gigaspora margarita]|uniref:5435_t:CDS:1 n=1 Tax=Gigaspora margarita TaxID=4874 RepID=A0ABN7VFU7_GIGMA|nr:5435_t:CDS:2 [Gigaspora margarita]